MWVGIGEVTELNHISDIRQAAVVGLVDHAAAELYLCNGTFLSSVVRQEQQQRLLET